MRLSTEDCRTRFAGARVARLGTVTEDGTPHLVPVTFVLLHDEVYFAVDHKPKRTRDLRRLRNIAANPAVSFLADRYEDDWDQLWWVRADGHATVLDEHREAGAALREKYPQYRTTPPEGPIVRTTVTRWTGWSFV
ncbi:TIGR03668 family PPOX class F420-dependent oxidoreductase [Amycolatopsis magusensis]|uniref:PPOX class probable F420-dependent enzyme n=1 Tax=Amycolatopsis magusensis TaxID=882444 RepID=A0ABS4PWX4_9PSEU|nr:TIGR03668 family PPOX class F420-dependent oxidoreductase [Amycolatopsis magusensis]MBP2183936.1 PPOX class probable F420-dependent enzyme [Amycolatopsis magusensis]MDI5976575.1 TIGR03668 family PPOX class F420-dependent oxidoreductase [Amycolatopsis magusensis]